MIDVALCEIDGAKFSVEASIGIALRTESSNRVCMTQDVQTTVPNGL